MRSRVYTILFTFIVLSVFIVSDAQARQCEHDVCLRFPAESHDEFIAPHEGLMDPFHRDNHQDGDRGYCTNYRGEDFPHCYAGHKGTDYVLREGFQSMAKNVPVVASATGEVIDYDDSNYDKCHASILDLLKQYANPDSTPGVTCGVDPRTGEPRPMINNYVTVRHFNGKYYIYTKYLHVKKNSVPAEIAAQVDVAKEAFFANGNVEDPAVPFPDVACGDRLAFVGSAGKSSLPHIHFEVRVKAGNPASDTQGAYINTTAIDPYYGAYLAESGRTESYWVNQEPEPNMLPSIECE